MNKIAAYLNEHLLGEVSSSKALRKRFSRDGSVLSIVPELVVFPRVTNDIRKVARFSWQLAEKGHPLGLTMRGTGADDTGAAVGKGIVINTTAHLGNIIQVATKDKLVHVQPGVTFDTLQSTLKWQGLTIPNIPRSEHYVTVGGAIANNTLGSTGEVAGAIQKLEVVLANGDLIETGRISRRDLSKKLGLQTFEGEIYRKIEGLVEDNEDTLKALAADPVRDNVGYKGLSAVRDKDGSFDLTPLFIGSQGTLGIISEVVLRTEFYSQDQTVVVATLDTPEAARDVLDRIAELEPATFEVLDGELFRKAAETGAQFALLGSVDQIGAVLYIRFNDFSDRHRASKLKKVYKILSKLNAGVVDSTDRQIEEFDAITDVGATLQRATGDDDVVLPLVDGSFVPADRREEFLSGVAELAHKQHLGLPWRLNVLTGTFDAYPILKLDVVSDKQKLFKLLNEYAELVHRCGGAFVSDGAEGRLKANAAWAQLEEAEVALYEQVRAIFDPFSTMNPGVKQTNDIRALISALRTSYDVSDFVN